MENIFKKDKELFLKHKELFGEKDPRKNESGALDLTAHEAMMNLEKESKDFAKLAKAIYLMCDVAGFQIMGTVPVMNKESNHLHKL